MGDYNAPTLLRGGRHNRLGRCHCHPCVTARRQLDRDRRAVNARLTGRGQTRTRGGRHGSQFRCDSGDCPWHVRFGVNGNPVADRLNPSLPALASSSCARRVHDAQRRCCVACTPWACPARSVVSCQHAASRLSLLRPAIRGYPPPNPLSACLSFVSFGHVCLSSCC